MTEQDVIRIIQREKDKDYRSGAPQVAPHTHDGNNNLKIASNDIIYPVVVNGTINMAQQTTYTLNLTGKGPVPTRIDFYGGALNLTESPTKHAFIVGNARFGANQQFQPSTSTSVVTGPVVENIIQGSASIIVSNAGTSILKNSQGHIVYAESPSGTLVAVADVTQVSNSSITVEVTTLAANWSISGLWVVS